MASKTKSVKTTMPSQPVPPMAEFDDDIDLEKVAQSLQPEALLGDEDEAPAEKPAPTPPSAEHAHHHRRSGIILGSILAVLLLIGAGLFAWYRLYYSSPEKVAADAMANLFATEHVLLNGEIVLTPKAEQARNFGLEQLTLSFDSSAGKAPSATDLTLKAVYAGGTELSFQLGTIMLQDGVAYVRIAGVMEALETAGLAEQLRANLPELMAFVENVDDEWWQISVPDWIAALELPTAQSDALNAAYGCLVEAQNGNLNAELGQLYRAHSFVNLARVKKSDVATGYSRYQVGTNYDKLASFINAMPNTETTQKAIACVNEKVPGAGLSVEQINEITADELKEKLPADREVYLDISNWRHQISKVKMQYSSDAVEVDMNMDVQYRTVALNVPEEYRPASELVDEIGEMIRDFAERFATSETYPDEIVDVEIE